MKNLFQVVARASNRDVSNNSITLQDWATMFQYAGSQYMTGAGPAGTYGVNKQEMGSDFQSYVQNAYKSNGVVFACMLARMNVFSEARFQWRAYNQGRPGKLFGTPELNILEVPWTNGTTGDLLTKAIVDADIAGNFYCARRGDQLRRLRPDWITIVLGSNTSPDQPESPAWDADVVGYVYTEGGIGSGTPEFFLPEEIAHWAPVPDPSAKFRGMSWMTPITNEILGDKAAMAHKLKFFEHGATPNIVVSLDPSIKAEQFNTWVKLMSADTEGLENAYKTLYLGGGAAAQVVGANLRQIDFKEVTSFGEVRIAAAAGVPPIIVGIAEGLRAATYSNYVQARRSFADATLRPLWRSFCSSMGHLVDMPRGNTADGVHLWYDDRDIPLLQQDQQDQATIQLTQASVLASLIASGYTPDSAKDALIANDMSLLEHTGLTSVQLQPPGEAAGQVVNPSSRPPNEIDPNSRSNGTRVDPASQLAQLLESRRLALEPGEG